jgi:hypothetical protein
MIIFRRRQPQLISVITVETIPCAVPRQDNRALSDNHSRQLKG